MSIDKAKSMIALDRTTREAMPYIAKEIIEKYWPNIDLEEQTEFLSAVAAASFLAVSKAMGHHDD